MARPLNEKLFELSAARREKIEARAAELSAEEMSLRDLRRALGKAQAKHKRKTSRPAPKTP